MFLSTSPLKPRYGLRMIWGERMLIRSFVVLVALVAAGATSASAQQNFIAGAAGLKDGTQAPPGIYAGVFGYGYNSGTVYGPGGTGFPIAGGGSNYNFVGALVSVVTKLKLFDANYGFTALIPMATIHTEIPRLNVSSGSGWGLTTTYLQPINLGWHTPHADILAGYAVYFPTGGWTFQGNNNFGLGMWTQEINAGTTLYLKKDQSVHLALELVYDINSLKKDTTYRQSDPLTLQGGLGVNYGNFAKPFSGWYGVAWYGQWTINPTTYSLPLGTINGPYPQNYGVGPEFVTLQGALTARYLWQLGTRANFQGGIWYLMFAMPI
jgi:hypothetical protein